MNKDLSETATLDRESAAAAVEAPPQARLPFCPAYFGDLNLWRMLLMGHPFTDPGALRRIPALATRSLRSIASLFAGVAIIIAAALPNRAA